MASRMKLQKAPKANTCESCANLALWSNMQACIIKDGLGPRSKAGASAGASLLLLLLALAGAEEERLPAKS